MSQLTTQPDGLAARRGRGLLSAVDYLLGYDVFVSYSRRGGADYAASLRRRLDLAGMSCFHDIEEIAAGTELRPALKRALTRSSALVVLVTDEAKRSPYVALEIETFTKRRRPIIPIRFGADRESLPWSAIAGRELVWIDETAPGADPSDDCISAIDRSIRHTRKRKFATRLMLSVAAGLVALSIVAAVLALRLVVAARRATAQQAIAEEATRHARDEQRRAEAAQREAERRRTAAIVESLARQTLAGNVSGDLALRMGLEAVKRAATAQLPVSQIAEHALRTAVARAGGVALFDDDATPKNVSIEIARATVSVDGRWLALSARSNSGVRDDRLYDLRDPSAKPSKLPLPDGVWPVLITERGLAVGFKVGYQTDRTLTWTLGQSRAKVALRNTGGRQFSPDGRWLFAANAVYELQDGQPRLIWPKHAEPGTISLDGRFIATMRDYAIHLSRVADTPGAPPLVSLRSNHVFDERRDALPWLPDVAPLPTQPGTPTPGAGWARLVQTTDRILSNETAFSPDSGWMMDVSQTGPSFLWNLRDPGFRRLDLDRPTESAVASAFSPESRYMVVAWKHGGRLYGLERTPPRAIPLEMSNVRTDPNRKLGEPMVVEFSRGGEWMAVAEFDTYVWDLRGEPSSKPRFVLKGATDTRGGVPITTLTFSPDGRWLVTGGRVSRLWDLSLPEPDAFPVALSTPEFMPNPFAFGGDSQWLVSIGGYEPAEYRAWPLSLADLTRVASSRAGELTAAERATLFPDEQAKPRP